MTDPIAHVADVMGAVRDGLHDWTRGLLRDGGLDLPVRGTLPTKGGPTVVLLPYQTVMESSSTHPKVVLMPHTRDGQRDVIPGPWRAIGNHMTTVLVDTFPKRPHRGPGIGPVHPCPPLAQLPPPLAAWYRARSDAWMVEAGEPSGRLPMLEWRQAFSLAVRFTAIVVCADTPPEDLDATQLKVLALLAAGVRLKRNYRVFEAPYPAGDDLATLVKAFSQVDHPAAAAIAEALPPALAPRELSVGLSPHNELTDQDLALIMTALRQPMQPSLVFSLRVSLGAGPELSRGALPHLDSVLGADT